MRFVAAWLLCSLCAAGCSAQAKCCATTLAHQCATVDRSLKRLLIIASCSYAASLSTLNCASPAEAHKLEALERRGGQPRSKLDVRCDDVQTTDGWKTRTHLREIEPTLVESRFLQACGRETLVSVVLDRCAAL